MQFVFHGFHGAAVSIAYGQRPRLLQGGGKTASIFVLKRVFRRRRMLWPSSKESRFLFLSDRRSRRCELSFGAPTAWAKLQHMTVMQQAIEHSAHRRGNVEKLVIENSIVGPILVEGAGELTTLEIRDSIVDGQNSADPAISVPAGRVFMRRTTVFGEMEVEWLDASETLITGFTSVTNTQEGCFRFSAVLERQDPLNPASPHSRVPHPYESYFVEQFNAVFTSTIFGQPGYAQLAESAPEFLRRGAENTSEIGAFSSLLNPILFDALRAKVEEFAPFGLLPVYIFET